jgi:hypothetical protein
VLAVLQPGLQALQQLWRQLLCVSMLLMRHLQLLCVQGSDRIGSSCCVSTAC